MSTLDVNTEYTTRYLHTTCSIDNFKIDLNVDKNKTIEFVIEDNDSFFLVNFKPNLIKINYTSDTITSIKVNGLENYIDSPQKILDYVVSSEVMLDLVLKNVKSKN